MSSRASRQLYKAGRPLLLERSQSAVSVQMTSTSFNSDQALDLNSESDLVQVLLRFLEHREDVRSALRGMRRMLVSGALEVGDPFETKPTVVERLAAIRWFSQCAGSIRDLEIPQALGPTIRARLEVLQKKCWRWTFPESPDEEPDSRSVQWVLDEARRLLNLITRGEENDPQLSGFAASSVDRRTHDHPE